MLEELIRLANHLDSKGLTKEADYIDMVVKKIAIDDKSIKLEDLDGLYGNAEPPSIPPNDNSAGFGGDGENEYYKRLFESLKSLGFDHHKDESEKYYFHMHKNYKDSNDYSSDLPDLFRLESSINTSISSPHFDIRFCFVVDDLEEGEIEVNQQELMLFGFDITSESMLSDVKRIFQDLDKFFKAASMPDLFSKCRDNDNFNCLEYALTQMSER